LCVTGPQLGVNCSTNLPQYHNIQPSKGLPNVRLSAPSCPLDLGFTTLKNRAAVGSMHTGLEETQGWNRVAEFYATVHRGDVGLMVTGGHWPRTPKGRSPMVRAMMVSQKDVDNHSIVHDRVPRGRRQDRDGQT